MSDLNTRERIEERDALLQSEGVAPQKPNISPHGSQRRKRTYGPIDLTAPPSDAHMAANPHTHAEADRFSMFTPEQVEDETKNVRLDLTFGDPLKVRDQAEMIVACMQEIIRTTRDHKLGSIRQRVMARREADSLRRAMARFNGKCPHGDRYIPKDRR